MKFFEKVRPSISVPVFYAFTTVLLLLRYVLGTLLGSCLSILAIYYFLRYFGDVRPLSLPELVLWVDGLDKEYKIGVFSAIITIVGFVIAFYTATLNWKSQMKAQLKLAVAGEIEDFFNQVSRDINSAKLYVKLITDAVADIKSGCDVDQAIFYVNYIQQQNTEFIAVRQKLSNSSIEVHRLMGKNYNLLATGWNLVQNLEEATKYLSEITHKMWIKVPIVDIQDPDCLIHFLKSIDVPKCEEFIEICNSNYCKINAVSGSIRGYLTSPVIGLNIFSLLNMLAIKGQFIKTMAEVYHQNSKRS